MRASRFLNGAPCTLTDADLIVYFVILIIASITLLICMIWNNERPLRKSLILLSIAVPFFGALAAHFFALQSDDDPNYFFISVLSLLTVANITSFVQFLTTI